MRWLRSDECGRSADDPSRTPKRHRSAQTGKLNRPDLTLGRKLTFGIFEVSFLAPTPIELNSESQGKWV